jgi:hypothetical protein
MTAWPLAPPIPELVIATRGKELVGNRQIRSTTFKRYSSHLMAGFFVVRFTFGGISPVSRMESTLLREVRNAVISECLFMVFSV